MGRALLEHDGQKRELQLQAGLPGVLLEQEHGQLLVDRQERQLHEHGGRLVHQGGARDLPHLIQQGPGAASAEESGRGEGEVGCTASRSS